jgi:hypothetical protein
MAANDVQITITGRDNASPAFNQVLGAAKNVTTQLDTMGKSASMVNSLFSNSLGVAAGIAGYQGLSAAIQGTIGASINFAKTMETNQNGIAGILVSMTQIEGRNLNWNEALGISQNIMGQLNDEALRTAATSEELVNAFRALLGPGLAAKMTIDQIVQLTTVGANAVKSLGLDSRQVVQELRDLVQGGIQPASSTLATALGLKDKDIEAAKQSSEGLFKFLMDRLQGFQMSAAQQQNTWQGRIDQIKEGIERIGATGLAPVFDAVKSVLGEIGNQLITVDDKTGKLQVNPQLVADLQEGSRVVVKLGGDIRDMATTAWSVAGPAVTILASGLKTAAMHADQLAIAFAAWKVATSIGSVITDITAATAGATTAQTFLGRAVIDTQAQYARQTAVAVEAAAAQRTAALAAAEAQVQAALAGVTAETAAVAAALGQTNLAAAYQRTTLAAAEQASAAARTGEVIAAANTAAAMGQVELADAIITTNLTIEEQGALAATMAERMAFAAEAARMGQIGLAESILAANVALTEQAVASTAAGSATVGAAAVAGTAVRGLTATVWALAGGWYGVAAAIAYATYQYGVYLSKLSKGDESVVSDYDEYGNEYKKTPKDPVAETQRRNRQARADIPEKPFMYIDPSTLTNKYDSTGDGKAKKGKSDGAEKAYEEQQRLIDKLADMTAKMNEKILAETGTTLETNTAKMTDEIQNMQRELSKSKIDLAKYGLDTSGVEAKMVQYENIIRDKYEKAWRRAWQDLDVDQAKANAQLLANKELEADAEYQATKNSLDRQREEKLKAVQRDRNDRVAALAVEQWYTAQLTIAAKKQVDAKMAAYQEELDRTITHNNLLVDLEGKTQAEIDTLNKDALNAKIGNMELEIEYQKQYGLTPDQVISREREIVAAKKQLYEIDGRNMETAATEYMRRSQAATLDCAGLMVDAENSIASNFVDNTKSALSNAESFASGFKNIMSSLTSEIESMFIKMWYEIYLKQSVQNLVSSSFNWFSGLLGGSKTPAADTAGLQTDVNIANYGSSVTSGATLGFATGGLLTGPGTSTSDNILLRGSPGEFMVKASAVRQYGVGFFNALNNGKIPRFADGGLIGGTSSGGNVTTVGGVQVIVNNNSSSQVTATDAGIGTDGLRQIIIEVAPDAVLDKMVRSPAYSRNVQQAMTR